jgi:uncharacterized protein (TIGR03437 family)
MIGYVRKLALLLAAAAICFGQRSYTSTPITAPSGYRLGSLIWISDDGKTGFGGALIASTGGTLQPSVSTQCLTYQNGAMSLLATPGLSCTPVGANAGKYIANLGTDSAGVSTVASITNGSNTVLTPPSGVTFYSSISVSVNPSGQMATTLACPPPTGYVDVFRCAYTISSNGTFTRLSDLGYGSGAVAINANGDVAGWVGESAAAAVGNWDSGTHAVVWLHTGTRIDLSSIANAQIGWPIAINSKGQAITQNSTGTSFFFDGTATVTQIQVANSSAVHATSLDDNGEIVGWYTSQSNDGLQHPFYQLNGTALDLNAAAANLSGGAILTVPTYINNSGQILSTVVYSTTPAGETAGTEPVQFLLTPVKSAPLTVNPASLSFAYQTVGTSPAPQSIQVTAPGGTAVSYTAAATSTGDWLSVTQSGGTTPASLTVSVAGAGLAAGVYSGQIVLTASTAGSPQTVIPVSLTVMITQTLSAGTTSLNFNWRLGDSLPSQTIQVTALGNAPVSFTAEMSNNAPPYAASDCAMFSVTPSSGTTPATLTVSVTNAASQISSSYTSGSTQCFLVLTASTAGNAQTSIPTLLTTSSSPVAASPTSLNFSYQVGGAVPPAQSVQLSGPSSAAVPFGVSIQASSNISWFSFTPTSGTTPTGLTVSVSPTGFAAGTYTADLIVNGTHIPVSLTIASAGTAPAPAITSVVNGASFVAGTSSNTWISIEGTNLSATARAWAASDFVGNNLPTSLDGVSVTVNGLAAYPSYISPTQINALGPLDGTTGPVQVQVTNAQGVSNNFIVTKSDPMPALFEIGSQYAAARHADGTLVGAPSLISGAVSTPAAPGETILVFGTGFGAIAAAVSSGQVMTLAAALSAPVTASIGGQPATVTYAGMTSNGLDQLNITIPAGLSDGDALIAATVNGVSTQSNLSVTVKH